MTNLFLRAQSVRVPAPLPPDKRKKPNKSSSSLPEETRAERDMVIRQKVTKHMIANSLMVICGHPPVSNYGGLAGLWKPSNKIYNELLSDAAIVNLNIESSVREVSTTFKAAGKDTNPAPTGDFDRRWFEHAYGSSRVGVKSYNPRLVDEFIAWLAERYPKDTVGSFGTLMSLFEDEIMRCKSSKGEYAKSVLPEKFHAFGGLLKDTYHDNGHRAKFVTKPYFIRPDGSVISIKDLGSALTSGGPRHVFNACFDVSISLSDETYYQIRKDRTGGPGFASLGMGGLCWILDGEANGN